MENTKNTQEKSFKFLPLEYTLPDTWASAIINGDSSELSDEDESQLNKWLEIKKEELGDGHWDIKSGEDGEIEESSFSKYHDAQEVGTLTADCLTFIWNKKIYLDKGIADVIESKTLDETKDQLRQIREAIDIEKKNAGVSARVFNNAMSYYKKDDDINRRHQEEVKELGLDRYSKEASDLWDSKYKDEYVKLVNTFTDKEKDTFMEIRKSNSATQDRFDLIAVYKNEETYIELAIEEKEAKYERDIMENAKTEFPFAFSAIGYFIDKQYDDGKLDDVFKETYQRTSEGEDKRLEIQDVVLEREYSYLEYIEDINAQVEEIVGDDPNCSLKTPVSGVGLVDGYIKDKDVPMDAETDFKIKG